MQIRRVVEAIAKARQPIICAGGGVWLADAQAELLKLAEDTGIPVTSPTRGTAACIFLPISAGSTSMWMVAIRR